MSWLEPDVIEGQPPEVEDPNALLAVAEGGYEAPDVETDQDAIAQQVFTDLAGRVDGWQAHDGNLDTWLVESFSEVGAEIRSLAADVPASIFMTYGQLVLGIPPKLATGAGGLATIVAKDDAGYTLDNGAQFALAISGNDLVAFQTQQQVSIPPGETEVDGVPFTAVLTGANGNGLSGAGQMLDPVTWVQSVTVPDATTNGADAETPQDYLDRLVNLLPVVALRPILPQDFATLALQVDGVGRAVAMNLYNPADGTWTNARTVTLILTDANGSPCSAAVKAQVEQQLEALREVNWVVHVVDATYTPVAVAFDVIAFAGQDASTVHDTAVANVTAYLQPGGYRLGVLSPAIAGGEVITPPNPAGTPTRRQYIYENEVIALLDRSLGVDRVVSVKINGAATDYQLPSPYSLPTPGAVTGTVEGANP